MIFVDTNYFLRFLLGDVLEQQDEVKKLFLAASKGEKRLFTSLIVVFEVYWVIRGQFRKDKNRVVSSLNNLFELRFIEFENLDLLKSAIKIYESTNLGLVDAYNLVYAKEMRSSDFKTFDKAFLKKIFKN